MTLALSIGAGPIRNVQSGSIVSTTGANPVGTLAAPSTGGTLLLAVVAQASSSSASPLNGPAGWDALVAFTEGANSALTIFAYPFNPGGISAVNFTGSDQSLKPIWYVHLSEWLNVWGIGTYLDSVSSNNATGGTTLALATGVDAPNPSHPGELVIAAWIQGLAAPGTPTFTTPSGMTRLIDNGASSLSQHLDIEFLVGPPSNGLPFAPTLRSSATTSSAVGALVSLIAGPAAADQTPYLAHDSQSIKQNTADFALFLGGHYLLESVSGGSAPDGYLLEDGSGVLLLDCYVPQLGDPVTFTNPAWSGRVVNVEQRDIVDKLTNYQEVTVSATNSTAAPGGTAPGDFSNVKAGGYFVLEDASGDYQLEDGSGNYEQEGTTYPFRRCSVKKSQNQDGTTTTYGSLETFEGGFAAGQTILLTNPNLGIAATQYAITNVTTTFIGAGPATPLYLIEFGDAYQTLQLAGGGVLTQQGSQANIQQGVAMPGGTLGYAQVTDTQGTFSADTDITGLTVTVTVKSGRRIAITAKCGCSSSVAGDVGEARIKESGSQLESTDFALSTTGGFYQKFGVVLTPTAGVHTYNVSMLRASGTGVLTSQAGATFPAWILVEDIGT